MPGLKGARIHQSKRGQLARQRAIMRLTLASSLSWNRRNGSSFYREMTGNPTTFGPSRADSCQDFADDAGLFVLD